MFWDLEVMFQESGQLLTGESLKAVLMKGAHQPAKVILRDLIGISDGFIRDYMEHNDHHYCTGRAISRRPFVEQILACIVYVGMRCIEWV